jgi:alkanesulfonate monooxygenase SsuD/methylene tetrahydromethanopterin reductase-like flavin-dependent oxidoreductase (luciferase family)
MKWWTPRSGRNGQGFDSFVLADLPGALSPLIALAAVARATTTIGLAPFVLNTGLWNPATVARDLATLDRVSGGRLEINLGSGIPLPALQGVIPPDRDARFERLRVTIEALKAAFAAPGITPGFAGRPRLLVAGTGDRTLRLAAAEELAAIHTYLTPAQIRSSPKILIGTAGEIAAQVLDRGKRLGLSYQVLRDADPEALADVIARVQGDSGH